MTAQILSLHLTPEQTCTVAPILAQQREGGSTAILSVVSSSYEPLAAQATVKLELAWLERKLARKVVELIRKAGEAQVQTPDLKAVKAPAVRRAENEPK